MTKGLVHLGYEVGTDKAVSIPLRHMVVTGQTQEAGKTTTLEALIGRAQLPAIAFITKRGERSFEDGRRIQPYFRERADWQFVASVLEAAMREKLRFERAWIMRASKGAATLADVHRNVRKLMEKAKGLSADVYLTLDHYLEIVVPRIAKVRFADKLDLSPGINVLDLADRDKFPPELQSLVMRSSLEWVYERCEGTITIIPEAWEFLPQGRGSPVKLSAVELIRKGAGLRNFVWLDSQDIGGVDKELLRSCPVWLLGKQREANEIGRVLENIPAGVARPKPSDIATLKKGQFYACFDDVVVRTYVQPAWMEHDIAEQVALGILSVEQAVAPKRNTPKPEEEEFMSTAAEEKLDKLIELVTQLATAWAANASGAAPALAVTSPPPAAVAAPAPVGDEEALYQRFKARLAKEAPTLLKVLEDVSEVRVEQKLTTVETDMESARGMVAMLIAEGFLDDPKSVNTIWKEVQRRWGYGGIQVRIDEQMKWFHPRGFVTKEADGYVVVAAMKRNIKKVG